MAFRKIVVGTDFSSGARATLRRALHLDLAPNAELLLVHACSGDESELGTRAREVAGHLLGVSATRIRNRLARDGRTDVRVEHALAEGRADVALADLASRAKADLVIVGAHGERRLRNLFIGTTPNRLLARCGVPVLVVRGKGEPAYKTVVAAVDLGEGGRAAIAGARALAPARAKVLAVHAAVVPFESVLAPHVASREIAALRRDATARASAELAQLLEPGVKPRIGYGDARDVLDVELEALKADAVVVARKRRTRVGEALLGSVTDHLVRSAPCDVLVVATEAKS